MVVGQGVVWGWKDRCEISAVHGECRDEHEVNQSRRCREATIGVYSALHFAASRCSRILHIPFQSQLSMSTKCRQSTCAGTGKAHANKCRAFANEGPAQAPHGLADTRYLPTQAGWQTHKRRQGTSRQVQSTREQEGHAVQAPWHNWPPKKCDLRQWWIVPLTSALWASGRGSWPRTWWCSRTC